MEKCMKQCTVGLREKIIVVFIIGKRHQIFALRVKSELHVYNTARKKFSMKNLFSKCEQIRRKLLIWSHLLNKSLAEDFIFCVV